MYGGCTDVWAIQTYGRCMGAYKHTRGTEMQGGIQTYRGHINVWGMYRCIHTCIHRCIHTREYRCMGAYRHTGGIQIYGDVQMYGGVDIWGHTDTWGMYGGVHTYRGCTDVWGHTDIWEVYRCGVIQTPPVKQTARHTSHIPSNYTWVLYFL